MKRNLLFFIISLIACCAQGQELYIGSFYVTSTEEEKLYGDGGDKWANRMPVICDMLNFEDPDVMGLQSLTDSQLSSISKRMTNHDVAGDILYNKKTLTLLASGTVENLLEGSTCTWAKLQKGETAFCVFNMNFSTIESEASSALTRVITVIGEVNTESLPCFVVGKIGTNESTTVYTRLNARYPDCKTKASVVSAEYGTYSGFDLAANHDSERFDFVFASKNVRVKAYGQLEYGYLTQESDGSYKRRHPSTHFPVMAKVTLP